MRWFHEENLAMLANQTARRNINIVIWMVNKLLNQSNIDELGS